MKIQQQINEYFSSLPDSKRLDMETLHERILNVDSKSKLWFLDGKDHKGNVVTNPNIGYGLLKNKYANGKIKEFYKVGISGNSKGISVYLIGIKDKMYLSQTYGNTIGKALVSSYCIKFRSLKELNIEILEKAIIDGLKCH